MHWRNDKEWELWNDRLIDGTPFPFTHLRSFDMPVVKAARGEFPEFRSTVRVIFDCHVVTEYAKFIEGDSRFWRDSGGNGRKFDPVRYAYSLSLPALLEGLPTGKVKCYVAKTNNYMVWESSDPANSAHYQAFFDMYKSEVQPEEGDLLLILYVQSAYLKDDPRAIQRERYKSFGQICAELAGLQKPKAKGPKSRIRKK